MTLLAWVIVAVHAQGDPGPLDAFRANAKAIRVNVEFEYSAGLLDSSALPKEGLWGSKALGFVPRGVIVGRWESDGESEHFVCGPDRAALTGPRSPVTEHSQQQLVPFELLFGGEFQAYHPLGFGIIDILATESAKGLIPGTGPFRWWDPAGFPHMIEEKMSGARLERLTALHDGHPTEVEVYSLEGTAGDDRTWMEIAYDPSVGYLPRYSRMTFTVPNKKSAWVKQFYLVDARPCAAGGFVPTEWYETYFSVDDFLGRYPEFTHQTLLSPTSRQSRVGYFRATKFEDRRSAVALDHLDGVRMIAAPGGFVGLPATVEALTVSDIRALCGSRLTRPLNLSFPALDVKELHEHDKPPGPSWWIYVVPCLIIAAAVFIAVRRLRRSSILLLSFPVVAFLSGCSEPARIGLKANFAETTFIADSGTVSMTLLVSNTGNRALRILGVDGGCACRQVDQSELPVGVNPGAKVPLPVKMSHRRQYQPETILFSFQTDHGAVQCPVVLDVLPSDRLNPEAPINVMLSEEDQWEFELVHRQLYRADEGRYAAELVVPPDFVATELRRESGHIARAPQFAFTDVTYTVRLVDRSLGFRRDTIGVRGPDGRVLTEAPVLWRRLSFLSCLPDMVMLGARPVRVFLRCPDETVELTKVLSAPPGIKAVVSSPREVTVMLGDDPPEVLKGVIEVDTTAEGRGPLQIPIVRYAPKLETAQAQVPPGEDE
jgi:hypothetical protein